MLTGKAHLADEEKWYWVGSEHVDDDPATADNQEAAGAATTKKKWERAKWLSSSKRQASAKGGWTAIHIVRVKRQHFYVDHYGLQNARLGNHQQQFQFQLQLTKCAIKCQTRPVAINLPIPRVRVRPDESELTLTKAKPKHCLAIERAIFWHG